jgi:hypothetical protein
LVADFPRVARGVLIGHTIVTATLEIRCYDDPSDEAGQTAYRPLPNPVPGSLTLPAPPAPPIPSGAPPAMMQAFEPPPVVAGSVASASGPVMIGLWICGILLLLSTIVVVAAESATAGLVAMAVGSFAVAAGSTAIATVGTDGKSEDSPQKKMVRFLATHAVVFATCAGTLVFGGALGIVLHRQRVVSCEAYATEATHEAELARVTSTFSR